MTDVVQKLWGFCNTLKHDGMHYGDYIEQLTYLLFLKLADEKGLTVPNDHGWASLLDVAGTDLTDHYQATLNTLGEENGHYRILTIIQKRPAAPVQARLWRETS
jgi:type I restriction enzyme M protein